MKRIRIMTLMTLLLVLPVSAFCVPVSFSTDYTKSGGYSAPVSAFLDYTVSGNTLSISLDNTSALFDSNGSSNSPAIVALGFNTANETSGSLQVQAFRFLSGTGSGALTDISDNWTLQQDSKLQGTGGLRFDFIPRTDNGVQYGLINPLAAGTTGSNLYETTAYLTIEFTSLPGDITDWYIRFQNVGAGGAFSVDAPGTPTNPVPEPATMILLGTGLLGLGSMKKRFSKQN